MVDEDELQRARQTPVDAPDRLAAPAAYPVYAEYLARFIETYRRHGLHVFGVTPTNEPDYPQSRWPSMAMSPSQQARFIARFLAPCLRAHGLGDVRIMCWDHNYSTDHYPDGRFVRELYMDPRAFAATAGSAWHYYGGAARTMSDIHRRWPTKGIWVTEASGETGVRATGTTRWSRWARASSR